MDSISTISKNSLTKINSFSLSIPARELPLSQNEINLIDLELQSNSTIEDVYGSVPLKDVKGDVYSWVWGKTGSKRIINPEGLSDGFKKSLLTPANPNSIIMHIVKLAAMVRDTRGEQALTVVAVEIARECRNVSEWAVIEACRDYWKTGAIWYPNSGELLKSILEKDKTLKESLTFKSLMIESNDVVKQVSELIGEDEAKNWFSDCQLLGKKLIAGSTFKADWIRSNYLEIISHIANEVTYEKT